jgi:hypothetical protein
MPLLQLLNQPGFFFFFFKRNSNTSTHRDNNTAGATPTAAVSDLTYEPLCNSMAGAAAAVATAPQPMLQQQQQHRHGKSMTEAAIGQQQGRNHSKRSSINKLRPYT